MKGYIYYNQYDPESDELVSKKLLIAGYTQDDLAKYAQRGLWKDDGIFIPPGQIMMIEITGGDWRSDWP